MKRIPGIWQQIYATPHRLAWIEVDGVRTRILEAGPADAPALLLLHGTAGSLENFCANIAAFAEHFRVIAIDMLGCGRTDKPPFDYRIQDYARHALGVLDALDLQEAAVVGVSLGAWVAAAMALEQPARVRRLVLVAPAGIIVDAEEERRFAEGVRQRRANAAGAPSWESVSKAMQGLVLDPATLSDELIAIRLDIYRQPEMAAAMPRLLAFSLGGQALSDAQWQSLQVPILVVAAVDAPNMFLKNAQAIARQAPQATLVEIPGCDHWAQYEQPERFHAATIPFLLRA